jgi:hypothetical protein
MTGKFIRLHLAEKSSILRSIFEDADTPVEFPCPFLTTALAEAILSATQ